MNRNIVLVTVVGALALAGGFFYMNSKGGQSLSGMQQQGRLVQGVQPAAAQNAEKSSGRTNLQANTDPNAPAWAKRCDDTDQSYCEIVQQLSVVETGQRLIEFAIGFPQQKPDEEQKKKSAEGKDTASGVIILPLGVLLESGMRLQVDDHAPYKFQARFCQPAGCYAFISLPGPVLELMRKGDTVTVAFKEAGGKTVDIKMSLKGFTKALESIS